MGNILSKIDKSTVKAPNGDKRLKKRKQYSWSENSTPGEFMMVSKVDLNIDGDYQRGEVSKSKVLEIAKNWDWRLFGALSVVMREDGSLWIYDGGHRARAAFYRDEVLELPCLVFESKAKTDEAKVFLGTNTLKSNVSAVHFHRAAVVAQDPVAVETQQLLAAHGYKVAKVGQHPYCFNAISALEKMVRINPQLAKEVFSLCAEIAENGGHIPAATLLGLFFLAQKAQGTFDLFSKAHREKLKGKGMAVIESEIRRERHLLGLGGQRVAARAILNLLNHGKRNKTKIEL